MTPFLEIAGWTLIHFLWQGTAIGLATALALRATARRSANVRYIVACAGLALMLAAPVATTRLLSLDAELWSGQVRLQPPFDVAQGGPEALEGPGRVVGTTARRNRVEGARLPSDRPVMRDAFARLTTALEAVPVDRVVRTITICWLVGVSLLLGRMAGGWWYVRRLHHLAMKMPASAWQTPCRRIAYRLGLPAAAHVVESALVEVPTVVGWLRPAILLPMAAMAALSPAQIEAVLAHELAHIRRHDYAVNLLQTIAETVLFYHPAVWWLSARVRAEREHCCDE
ncbi:MAG TPA: M56 family metallopeptidase, partial [Vicinamibacterales bacterium]|nr:M56 family metallopeptidase [Vicinamibacterales bacterium]